ncbi:serine/threonine-protein phosphatase [Acidobacteria bacterium AB60]|nr:serine/threonine-protein phosphatase [Acidobacteria bacterium AB60]
MRPRILLTFVLLCAGAALAAAQTAAAPLDITHLHGTRFLDSPWLVQAGDNPAWASPAFDDSRWTRFDPYSPINAIYGEQRPPILWYRLHLADDPAEDSLALSEIQIARAFEIYVNGELVMRSGQVEPFHPRTTGARLLAPIPQQAIRTGSLVIALRLRISPSEWGNGQNPGYYGNNLAIGPYADLQHEAWLTILGDNALPWFDHLFTIGLGIIALLLFSAERRQKEYLWIAALGLLTLLEFPSTVVESFRNIPVVWDIVGILPRGASPYLWAGFYFSFAAIRIDWRWRTFLVIAGIGNLGAALQQYASFNILPVQIFLNLPYIVFLSIIVPVVLALRVRRGGREAAILFIPAVLFSLYIYAEVTLDMLFRVPGWKPFALRGLNLIDNFHAGPFALSLNPISGILCTASVALIVLGRSATTARRQALLDAELEAARQVQQVLVPEHTGTLPGFAVESVYLPAQQVGGDFFQILPDNAGGLLLVVGDVAGKGLPAAMLVSVIVGAIRATAEFTRDPAQMLASLNERLVGRAGGGFSTALAAHISEQGQVTVANAGHLPPYLDGREIDLPGALPLGVAPGVLYESSRFALDPRSRLTFYSDGVVEAQNPAGELLGFERSRDLSRRPAPEIAAAAQSFGQHDDITVLTIERTPVPALA